MLCPARADAQCGSNASSCVSCHEAQQAGPVLADGKPWHADHGFGDLCVACHSGDPAAASKAAAHKGMLPPLDDALRSCGGCHAEDADDRAARYRALVTSPSGTVAKIAAPPSSLPPPPASLAASPGACSPVDRMLLAAVGVLTALLVLIVLRDRRVLVRLRPGQWLRARTWNAHVAGAGFGLVVAASEAGFGRPLAASGAFDRLAAYLGRALFPTSPYYGYVMRPEIGWQVWLMLGVLAGAATSAKLAGVARRSWLPDTGWTERFGTRRSVRLLVAFLGAVLVQFGADVAGGCTSGLAISGGAVLSPAAFTFMAGMFASGIPTAWLWYGLREKK
jgi:uncharacterized protein